MPESDDPEVEAMVEAVMDMIRDGVSLAEAILAVVELDDLS